MVWKQTLKITGHFKLKKGGNVNKIMDWRGFSYFCINPAIKRANNDIKTNLKSCRVNII
jgi:hypothetical protein